MNAYGLFDEYLEMSRKIVYFILFLKFYWILVDLSVVLISVIQQSSYTYV